MMGKKIVRISSDLLCRVLLFPPGTQIVAVSPHVFFDSDEFALKIEHPGFPDQMPDHAIPVVRPHYRTETKDGVTTLFFVGWGSWAHAGGNTEHLLAECVPDMQITTQRPPSQGGSATSSPPPKRKEIR